MERQRSAEGFSGRVVIILQSLFKLQGFAELTLGLFLIVLTLFDVFQTIVVPRWTSRRWRLAPHLIAWLWRLWLAISTRLSVQRRRDEWLGAFAPLCVLMVLCTWVVMLITGYGWLIYALHDQLHPKPSTFIGCCYIAGTSLLTIGYGDFVPTTTVMRLIFLSCGAIGLATFALVISWLFTLYQAFARRETLVLTLGSRAGTPPAGLTLLETYAALQMIGDLHTTFTQWELWTADVLDSHLAFPLLPFFRSSHDDQSWISAMGAVLDAATLLITTVESHPGTERLAHGSAQMMYRLGCHAVDDLSKYFRLRLPPRLRSYKTAAPQPGVEINEWRIARRELEKAGFVLRSEAEAWDDFAHKRTVYAWELNTLAKLFVAAPTQWIGDRSNLPYLQPNVHSQEVSN